jgi:hypothetical protein
MLQKQHQPDEVSKSVQVTDDAQAKAVLAKLTDPMAKMVDSILDYLGYGLIGGSVGERRYGGMCVQAVVSLVNGDDHQDRPTCVAYSLAAFGVGLNDCGLFEDDLKRAEALKRFAIAQLGTRDSDFHMREFDSRANELREKILERDGYDDDSSYVGMTRDNIREFADGCADILADMGTKGSKYLDRVK